MGAKDKEKTDQGLHSRWFDEDLTKCIVCGRNYFQAGSHQFTVHLLNHVLRGERAASGGGGLPFGGISKEPFPDGR